MTSIVDANKTDSSMGLKKPPQEPGETNENEVHNNQHGTKPEQIHTLPENQDDQSTLTSKGSSKLSTS